MMNKLIVIFLTFILLCSCRNQNAIQQAIDNADSLMDANSDSARVALGMLDRLKAEYPKMNEQQQMRYQLIYAKAMNKGFVDFTTDSVMKEVVAYYDKKGSANDRMLASYLLGCAYRDLKDSPSSLDWYHRATECADTTRTDCNYDLLAIVYGQIGMIFLDQEMPQNALDALDKTKQYAKTDNDTVLYLQALVYQANAYYKLGNKHKFLALKDFLFHQYLRLGMKQDAAIELCSTIYEYITSSNLAKAKQLMDSYERASGLVDDNGNVAKGKEIYYGTKGIYYLKSNQVDSAIVMFRRLLQTTTLIDEKEKAYSRLTQAYHIKGKLDSMAKYAILAKAANDSVHREMATNTLIRMQSLYNYEQMERKAKETELASQELEYQYKIVLIIFAFGGVLLFVFLWKRNIKRKLEMKIQAEQMQVKLLQYRQDNKELADAKQKLQILLSQNKQSGKNLKDEYEHRIAQLQERIKAFEGPSTSEECNKANELLNNSKIRAIIDKKAARGEYMTEEELKGLKALLKEHTPKLYAMVLHTELSENQFAICLLTRLKFTSSDIQHLLNISSGYATNAKKSIAKKLFGKEMQPKEFERKLQRIL